MKDKTNFPQQCKKCGNTIFASPCPYCNTSVEETQQKIVKPLSKNKSNIISIVTAVVLIIAVIFCISQCDGIDTEKSAKCGACEKTFTDTANRKSIALRNLCEDCYETYKWIQEVTP